MKEAAEPLSIIATGAVAAGLLETACQRAGNSASALRLEVVRDLAKSLKDGLDDLARSEASDLPPDLAVEAALRCADLANLAACNLDRLPAAEAARAAAGVQLAAGAIRALRLLVEAEAEDRAEFRETVLRDVRGAGWRADLAVRQVEGLLEAATEG